jgi:hypothetical protein
MLALFAQRMVVEFGLFRFLVIEDAFSVVCTCRAARVLKPRPRAVALENSAQVIQIWSLLSTVESLRLRYSDSSQETAAWLRWHPLPATLRELALDVDCPEALPAGLRMLTLDQWPTRFMDVFESVEALHTLEVNHMFDEEEMVLLAQACPRLKRLACYSLPANHETVLALGLEALTLVEADCLPNISTLRALKIGRLDHQLTSDDFVRLCGIQRLDLRAKRTWFTIFWLEVSSLVRLKSLRLERYTIFWDAKPATGIVDLCLWNVTIQPESTTKVDLRNMAELASVGWKTGSDHELVLPPHLEKLDLFNGVAGCYFDLWESFFAHMAKVDDLCLSWQILTNLYFASANIGRPTPGPETCAVLRRLRRLEMDWPLGQDSFLDSILTSTGPALRQLVIHGLPPSGVPEHVVARLDFLRIADKVLIPRKSLSRPENFLCARAAKIFFDRE